MSVVVVVPDVNELTTSYHSGGGIVCLSDTEGDARVVIESSVVKLTEDEWAKRTVVQTEDRLIPQVWTFPDGWLRTTDDQRRRRTA